MKYNLNQQDNKLQSTSTLHLQMASLEEADNSRNALRA